MRLAFLILFKELQILPISMKQKPFGLNSCKLVQLVAKKN